MPHLVTPDATPIQAPCDSPNGNLRPCFTTPCCASMQAPCESSSGNLAISLAVPFAYVRQELRATRVEVMQLLQVRHANLLKEIEFGDALSNGCAPMHVNTDQIVGADMEVEGILKACSSDRQVFETVGVNQEPQQIKTMHAGWAPMQPDRRQVEVQIVEGETEVKELFQACSIDAQVFGAVNGYEEPQQKKRQSVQLECQIAQKIIDSNPTDESTLSPSFKRSNSEVRLRSDSVIVYKNQNRTLLFLEKIVSSPLFEMVFSVFIVLNALVMAMEAQYLGLGHGHDVGVPGYNNPKEQSWPWAELFFEVLSFFFGCAFTLEVSLKLLVRHLIFFLSAWNLFDCVIVGLWLAEATLQFQGGGVKMLPVNPMALRFARLVRLLRFVRLVKTIQLFDVLRLMVGSLRASVHVLFWSFIFLFFLMLASALLLVFVLEDYITDEERLQEDKIEMFMYFGTFSRSMLSMFELTLGNWAPLTRLLNDKVSEWFCPALLTYHCCVAFAVMTVIRGIFLHETFQVAAQDDELIIMKKERQIRQHIDKMSQLFHEADDSGDGYLCESEFHQVMEDVRVKTWLAALELEVRDADLIFKLMDDGDGKISCEELVRGFSKLKGPSRSVDMVTLMYEHQELHERLVQLDKRISCLSPCFHQAERSPCVL